MRAPDTRQHTSVVKRIELPSSQHVRKHQHPAVSPYVVLRDRWEISQRYLFRSSSTRCASRPKSAETITGSRPRRPVKAAPPPPPPPPRQSEALTSSAHRPRRDYTSSSTTVRECGVPSSLVFSRSFWRRRQDPWIRFPLPRALLYRSPACRRKSVGCQCTQGVAPHTHT